MSENEVKTEVVNAEGTAAAPKATKPKKEKAPKPEKAPKDEKNGVVRPSADTSTGKIWGFADALSASTGEPAKRADVLKKAEEAGINPTTAATQFGRWCKYHGLTKPKATKVEEVKVEGAAE